MTQQSILHLVVNWKVFIINGLYSSVLLYRHNQCAALSMVHGSHSVLNARNPVNQYSCCAHINVDLLP